MDLWDNGDGDVDYRGRVFLLLGTGLWFIGNGL